MASRGGSSAASSSNVGPSPAVASPPVGGRAKPREAMSARHWSTVLVMSLMQCRTATHTGGSLPCGVKFTSALKIKRSSTESWSWDPTAKSKRWHRSAHFVRRASRHEQHLQSFWAGIRIFFNQVSRLEKQGQRADSFSPCQIQHGGTRYSESIFQIRLA